MEDSADELIPTRATLIQRLKNWQDQPSWQEFFETYWHLIYGVSTKRGLTNSEAQEVVQETMICVARHMPGFKYDPAIGSFKGWLMKLASWRIADQLRKRQPLAADQESTNETSLGDCEIGGETDHVLPELDSLWEAEWEKNLREAAMAKARRRLGPKQYQIFDFYVNKEWKPERVAKAFAVPVGQVYLAKHRVTEMIKHEVERLNREMI
jgi:RNA polymerase sigma-70 factor (ECF subfamily)